MKMLLLERKKYTFPSFLKRWCVCLSETLGSCKKMSHSEQEAYGLRIQTGEKQEDRQVLLWWGTPAGGPTSRLPVSCISFILRPAFSTARDSRAHPSIFTIRVEGSLFPCIWLRKVLQKELDWTAGALCLTLWKWGLELTGMDNFSLDVAWSVCMCLHVLVGWLNEWMSRGVVDWWLGWLGERGCGGGSFQGESEFCDQTGAFRPSQGRGYSPLVMFLFPDPLTCRVRAPEPSRFSGWDLLMLFTFFGHLKYFLNILQQISIAFII